MEIDCLLQGVGKFPVQMILYKEWIIHPVPWQIAHFKEDLSITWCICIFSACYTANTASSSTLLGSSWHLCDGNSK